MIFARDRSLDGQIITFAFSKLTGLAMYGKPG